jgi:uncharacterized membrane protein required for colicin V production
MKDAIAIAVITFCVICGAATGIVGGAFGIAGVAAAIHYFVDGGK